MKITLSYNKHQLDAAVEFIATHNDSFLGQQDRIRASFQEIMLDLAKDPEAISGGTMGFVIIVDERIVEDIDNDTNIVSFEILVDPNLGSDEYETYEEVIDV